MTLRTLLLALLPLPALAQEPPTSAALLDRFLARCAELAADPRAAINALADEPGDAQGAMTADGALAQVTEPTMLTDDVQAVLFFLQVVVEGEARQNCSLTVYALGEDLPFADMIDRVVLGAEDILGGPPVMVGGPAFGGTLAEGPRLAAMQAWHLAGAGPGAPVLTLFQDARTLSLGLGRAVPAP